MTAPACAPGFKGVGGPSIAVEYAHDDHLAVARCTTVLFRLRFRVGNGVVWAQSPYPA